MFRLTKVSWVLFVAVLLSQASVASACVSVKVKNESRVSVTAFWGAQGCAGAYDKQMPYLYELCTHHELSPGSERTYDYKWGTTALTVWLTFNVDTDYGGFRQARRSIYRHGGFQYNDTSIPGTPSSCHRHYSVTFTQADFEEDSSQ